MESITSVNHCRSTCVSVPSNPTSFNLALRYYNHPTGGLKTAPLASDHEVGSEMGDSSPDDEEFEFETRGKQKQEMGHALDVVHMAFADELFCNGQVMPLKPPPRLHYANNAKYSHQSSCAASPTSSPSSIMKGPFRRWSFGKNDNVDFDPFMVALEVVRNEIGGKELNSTHRRSRSLSPPRPWPSIKSTTVKLSGTEHPTFKKPNSYKRSISDRRIKPTTTTLPGPTANPSKFHREHTIKQEGSSRKGSKRFTTKDAITNNGSEKGTGCDEKLLLQSRIIKRPQHMRNLSFKAIQKNHYDEQKQLAKKRTLIPYRAPCMLVCLGFGHSGLRDLN